MKANQKVRRFTDDTAAVGMNTMIVLLVGTVVAILAVVLNLRVIAALLPTLAESSVSITTVFNSTDWGDPVANDISPIFAMVIAIVILLVAVALVFSSVIVLGARRKGLI